MIRELTLTVLPGDENDAPLIKQKAVDALSCVSDDIKGITINKKSMDARHGRQKIHLLLTVYINEDPPAVTDVSASRVFVPIGGAGARSVLIVGCGPAGLFAALQLLENGIKPVIVERGKRTA